MHHSLTVSPDGQEIYWAERRGIKYVRKIDGTWTSPTFVSFSGHSSIDWYDEAPVVSPDNTKLFFNSKRPHHSGSPLGWTFWVCDRNDNGWSEPRPLPDIINATGGIHWQVSVSATGTLYFGVFAGDRSNIYYSRFVNGAYTTPEPLEAINSLGWVICPFVSPDESYIIVNRVDNGRPDGYHISFKDNNDLWLPPQRLEGFPDGESTFVTRDGRYVFCKAYWASAQIIEDLQSE